MTNLHHRGFSGKLHPHYDIESAQRMVEAIGQSEPLWYLTIDDDKKRCDKRLTQNLFTTFDRGTPNLLRASLDGAAVFVSLNAHISDHRRLSGIERCRGVHGDFDNGLPGTGFPIEPTVIIQTSLNDRFLCLWLAHPDDLLSPSEATAINATIAADFGADAQAKDIARCVRLVGFPHQKAEPFRVRVVGGCKKRHAAQGLIEAFPAHPEPVRAVYSATLSEDNEGGYRAQALHDLEQASLHLSDLTDNRRNMVFSVGCQLAKYVSNRVLSEAELRASLRQAAAANGSVRRYGPRFVDEAITRALQMGRNDKLPPLARMFWQESGA